MSILIGIFTLLLILVSVFLILVVLAQKTKDGGMGAALGGGATESAFGHETGNVLTKATINAAILFFVLSFVLYLARIYESKHRNAGAGGLPEISAPAAVPGLKTGVLPGPATGATGNPNFKLDVPPATPTPTTPTAATTPPAPVSPATTPASPAADTSKPADAPKPAAP